MKARIKHTIEFKKQAVELLLSSDKTLKDVARDLGIHAATLRTWRQQAMIHEPSSIIPESKNGSRTEMERELRLLREQLLAKERACEILKKAIAICSESQGINLSMR